MPEFAGKIHGWQEAVVIRDGRIVFFIRLGKELRRIQEAFEELLKAYNI